MHAARALTSGISLAFASGVALWMLTYDAFILPTHLALTVGIAFDVASRVLPHTLALGALTGLLAPRTHPANLAAAAVLWASLAIAFDLGATVGGPAAPDAPTPLWADLPNSIGVALLTSLTLAAAAAASGWLKTHVWNAQP